MFALVKKGGGSSGMTPPSSGSSKGGGGGPKSGAGQGQGSNNAGWPSQTGNEEDFCIKELQLHGDEQMLNRS